LGPPHIGAQLHSQHGLGFFAVEYPGFGGAPGSPSEASIIAASESLLKHLNGPLGVSSSDIVLFGQSIGCVPAIALATQQHGARMVLASPFLSVPKMATAVYPFLRPVNWALKSLVKDQCDNVARSSSVRVPTLVIHGTEDEIVPYSHGTELHTMIKDSEMQSIPGAGHNDLFRDPAALGAVVKFATIP